MGPQNVERIIALGAPSATGLEELYKTGKLSRHEVQSRTIAQRKRQAEKVRKDGVCCCCVCSALVPLGTRFIFCEPMGLSNLTTPQTPFETVVLGTGVLRSIWQ